MQKSLMNVGVKKRKRTGRGQGEDRRTQSRIRGALYGTIAARTLTRPSVKTSPKIGQWEVEDIGDISGLAKLSSNVRNLSSQPILKVVILEKEKIRVDVSSEAVFSQKVLNDICLSRLKKKSKPLLCPFLVLLHCSLSTEKKEEKTDPGGSSLALTM